ncbi:SDR family oxidoreductase [Streptomyces sp. LMG1-1-1.1]|uniref:SDR family oxidoreductase n=1 Tax=Streptomyces sp. LMG1-1-1.1 TaxID=3135245 RepID=UPI003467E5B1
MAGLSRSLARALGPYGICVNSVLPGAIQVEAENTSPPSTASGRRTRSSASASRAVAGSRMSLPWWRFSWAPTASFITGQSVHVDGGWLLH